MQEFVATCEAVASTPKKTEKVRLVAEFLRSRPVTEAARAAIFFSGRAFPRWEEQTLNVGGAALWRAVVEVSGKGEAALTAAYRRLGDLGSAAQEALADATPPMHPLTIEDAANTFHHLAKTRHLPPKTAILHDLLRRASALETKYLVKIMGGDLRIGLRESLVEEAIAQAFGEPLEAVQRAGMMLGDLGETTRLAAAHRLEEARLRLFHPVGFMLASPAQDAGEAFACFQHAAVEDKYDGIRAQAHCGGRADPRVRIFSRTLDEISASFPELPPALLAFPEAVVLDGEILAWQPAMQAGQLAGRARPFSELQKRLGRKKVSEDLARAVPVVYMVFDILYAGSESLLEKPLAERLQALNTAFASVPEGGFIVEREMAVPAQGKLAFEPALISTGGTSTGAMRADPPRVIQAPSARADSPEHLDTIFAEARVRGNEGLMVKDLASLYTPGRRGKSWLKLKRALDTLDVVVTAVEWGHGKRARVLSDYTFAVRDGGDLLNVGKAYSGLTDREIAELTPWFLEHTVEDQGFRRVVEPFIVLEIAFNNMMRSNRHASGFALRFPRILRIRKDKSAQEIDTLDTVREIYEKQK